jgi:type I restriction enzyme S subunit
MSWTKVELGDVVSFYGGGTPSKSHPEYWGGNIPWATVKDIKGPSLDVTIDSITEEGLKNSASRIAPTGSVILPTRMALGKATITTVPVAINQDLKIAVPKRPLNSRFLLHFLQSASNEIQRLGAGATVQGVTLEKLAQIEMPLPPLDEQRKIAAVLDKADALRRQRQESLQLTEKILKLAFIDLFGDPLINPKEFPSRKLGEFFISPKEGAKCGPFGSALKKSDIQSSGVPVWGIDNISTDGYFISTPLNRISPQKYDELMGYSVQAGDIIISRAGTVGRMCVVEGADTSGIIGTNLIRLRLQAEILDPHYFVSLMRYFKDRLGRLRAGADGAFSHMGTGVLQNLEFPYPTPTLQKRFLEVMESISSASQYIETGIHELSSLFFSIQQRAFRGELDLSRLTLTDEVESPAYASAPKPPTLMGRYKRPGSFIAPPDLEAQMLALEDRLDTGPGDSIPWSEDFFKYRTLSQVLTAPFSFNEIWEAVRYDMEDASYEDVKAKVFEYIEAGILEQQFDIDRKEIVFYPRP